jgi:hypothetical protein
MFALSVAIYVYYWLSSLVYWAWRQTSTPVLGGFVVVDAGLVIAAVIFVLADIRQAAYNPSKPPAMVKEPE